MALLLKAPCPLLADVDTYIPDREDLVKDTKARELWLNCLYNGMDNVCAKAVQSYFGSARDLTARAYKAMISYHDIINRLRQNPL